MAFPELHAASHEKPREESVNSAGIHSPFHHFVFASNFFLDKSLSKSLSVRNTGDFWLIGM
jgi:hypothetical protein